MSIHEAADLTHGSSALVGRFKVSSSRETARVFSDAPNTHRFLKLKTSQVIGRGLMRYWF